MRTCSRLKGHLICIQSAAVASRWQVKDLLGDDDGVVEDKHKAHGTVSQRCRLGQSMYGRA